MGNGVYQFSNGRIEGACNDACRKEKTKTRRNPMKPKTILNGRELSLDGDLHIFALTHPTDSTKNGQIRLFRDDDPQSADDRARRLAGREGCGVIRKAVL